MEWVGVARLKANLSAYLARVQAGEEIMVSDRGKPIARLVPAVALNPDEDAAHLHDLARRGLLRLGTGRVPDEYWSMTLGDDPDASVRAALIEERKEGR